MERKDMTVTEIKNLAQIRNDEIETEIKNIKNIYNIEVTNELIEKFIMFSLNAIEYYNEKYNYFTNNSYESLYMFCIKQSNYYHYNILTSALYKNNKYIEFKNLTKLNNDELYKFYINIGNIICEQIFVITNKNTYIKKYNNEILIEKEFKSFRTIQLPYSERCLLISYLYYYNENKKVIIDLLQKELLDIDNHCDFLEAFLFNYNYIYSITNSNIELYFESILNSNDITKTNKKIHESILKYLLNNEI